MDNILKYKDFIGTVNFSAEDGVFYGKIEGIKSMVSFEGETVHDLEEDFKTAVDDYIEYCQRHNITPHKSYTGKITIKITPAEHSTIAAIAKNRGISVNAFVKNAISRELAS
ncbi:MAG: type II toxin-antitoxin system HicB family antitoxin [Bacteroidales bacterium]|nr:type II toxin-antitoxin system HicB family antitoxin [Bacteroidales bacterium]